MNKGELVSAVADETGMSQVDAKKAVDAVATVIMKTLKKKDGEVAWSGIGKFSTKKRPARTGRNPSTGAAVKIAARVAVKFKPAKELKDFIN